MKKILSFITLLTLLIPKLSLALVTSYNMEKDIMGFAANSFKSPFLMFLNVIAAIALTYSIATFMVGYTKWDLSSGNIAEMDGAKKILKRSVISFLFVFIVFIIDLSVY